MPADIRTLEKRIATLEQAADAQQAASTGIQSDDLRHDEWVALMYKLVPVQDGERVRQILRGELHIVFERPIREQDVTEATLARLERCMCIQKDSMYRYVTPEGPIGVWLTPTLEMRPDVREKLDNGWCVLECEDTAACGRSRTVERQRLLATGAYVEPDAPG